MTEKMRAYLDGIFSALPDTAEVREAKEELFASMVERYNDNLLDGMDEQQAYDNVIEGIGDMRELFAELGIPEAAHYAGGNPYNTQGQEQSNTGSTASFNIHEVLQSIGDFAGGLVNGLFGGGSSTGPISGELELVNTRTLPLDGISSIDVSYISEAISLLPSDTDQMVVKEYMNRNQPELYARVTMQNTSIAVKNGHRQGVFGLRSRVEIYLPKSWNGGLSLSTISGVINSDEEWSLASLLAKSTSGEVAIFSVEAGVVRLSTVSGAVKLHKGVGSLDLHSVSGTVRVDDVVGSGSFKTTSGSVRADFSQLNGSVEASTISGGVRLTLPADASFEFEGKTVSGGIYTGFDNMLTYQKRNKAHGFVGMPPYYSVRASSTSGSVHVND